MENANDRILEQLNEFFFERGLYETTAPISFLIRNNLQAYSEMMKLKQRGVSADIMPFENMDILFQNVYASLDVIDFLTQTRENLVASRR